LSGALARRLVTIPGILLLTALSVLSAPLWVPLLALVDLVRPGPRAALRMGAMATLYLHCEAAGLLASFVLWVLWGPWRGGERERYQERNFSLQRWWATTVFRGAMAIYGFSLQVEGQDEARRTPLLLFPRHASLADSLLPSALVSRPFGTRLRYVLKRELLWDPCLDVVGNRLPNHFVDRFSEDSAREIREVAKLGVGLGAGEGVILYPEGTRFTPAKRQRILERLRQRGPEHLADLAGRLERLLPPRSAGALALVESCPQADLVFCAHSGFERAASAGDLWSGALVGSRVRVRFWRVAAAEIPRSREQAEAWLFSWWERMDTWLRQGDEAE
jgi:1-acyl-sn-glycerol-3-phosphate acyltransferase